MRKIQLDATRGVAPVSDSDIAYGDGMTTRVRRRRGTPTEGSYYRLRPDVKQAIDDWSEQFDVPTWAIIEAMVDATKIGPNGVPEGWELPVATTVTLFDTADLSGGHAARKTA